MKGVLSYEKKHELCLAAEDWSTPKIDLAYRTSLQDSATCCTKYCIKSCEKFYIKSRIQVVPIMGYNPIPCCGGY